MSNDTSNPSVENQDTKDQNDAKADSNRESNRESSREVDPMDLVYKGGYTGNPREIIENPAVAPQMLNIGQNLGEVDADNLRDDMIHNDADDVDDDRR